MSTQKASLFAVCQLDHWMSSIRICAILQGRLKACNDSRMDPSPSLYHSAAS